MNRCAKREQILLHAAQCYRRWVEQFGQAQADRIRHDHLSGGMVLHYRDCATCQAQRAARKAA